MQVGTSSISDLGPVHEHLWFCLWNSPGLLKDTLWLQVLQTDVQQGGEFPWTEHHHPFGDEF